MAPCAIAADKAGKFPSASYFKASQQYTRAISAD
jgi:hypothetical protein